MKLPQFSFCLLCLFLIICACNNDNTEKVNSDIPEIIIDYSWNGPDGNIKNPEITLTGVPRETKFLTIKLVDLNFFLGDHGPVEKIVYDGNGIIPFGRLNNYIGPSPPPHAGRKGHEYEFTVQALDAKNVVIGVGKKTKNCCPDMNK